MIAVIARSRVHRGPGVQLLSELPEPPALRWSAFVVGLDGTVDFCEALTWAADIRATRPYVPIGLVGRLRGSERSLVESLDRHGLSFAPVVDTEDLDGALPRVVPALRGQSVAAEILAAWLGEFEPSYEDSANLLRGIALHGVRGGKSYTLHAEVNGRRLSERTIRRRLKEENLPTLAWLLRDARIRSVPLRHHFGASLCTASRAAGWTSVALYRKASRRHRERSA